MAHVNRLWFVTNVNSGTATPDRCEALEAEFAALGLHLAGRTRFPDDPIPENTMLERQGVDTVVLYAGDGTVNAALSALLHWGGAFLVLPGGTMNLLARALHDTLDPHMIVAAAADRQHRVSLPYVDAGGQYAFVGLIMGPAASWFRAREAARGRRMVRLIGAARAAWRHTFRRAGVRLRGAGDLRRSYQAVFVTPAGQGLEVAGVDARDWRSVTELGWTFLTGDWVRARAVEQTATPELCVARPRQVLALFDGEPVRLDAGVTIRNQESPKMFLSTKKGEKTAA